MKLKLIFKKFISFLTTVLFILLLSALLVVGVSKAAGNEANLFGYQVKSVLSGSMEPDIETGSIIGIKIGGDMQRFNEKDVITFRTAEDILITHRIVEVKNDGQQYITKGDANDGKDINPVLAENVIGKFTGFNIPYIGYIMNFAGSREGAALLLVLPGVLLISYSFITIRRTVKQVKKLMEEKEIRME